MNLQQAIDLARQYQQAGRLAEAEKIYRQLLVVDPNQPEVLHLLGLLAYQACKPEMAIELIRKAITIQPAAHFYNNLAFACSAAGKIDDAIAASRAALKIKSDYPQALNNLGNAYRAAERFEEAIEPLQRAIALQPNFAEALTGLGNTLMKLGRVDEAIVAYRQYVLLQPDSAIAHYNLAHALLLQGNFVEGWQEFAWRLKEKSLSPGYQNFPPPMWDGGDLHGKRILLHAEEGFGDTIQLARFVPLIHARGGRVLLASPPELQRFMRSLAGVEQLLTDGDTLPEIDVHCSLLSLPGVMRLTLETIPANVPYLHAENSEKEKWKNRLTEFGNDLKVGIAWAGRPTHTNDRNRSTSFDELRPLLESKKARFFSLQKGLAAEQARGSSLIDWTSELNDFAETAALIANLDLVIAVDTSIVHLAGALGKPTWVMLPFAPDWRWMRQRNDSPWYPTMRLFRQSKRGDWPTVVHEIVAALQAGPSGPGRVYDKTRI